MWNASSAIPGGTVGYYGNQPLQQQLPPSSTQPSVGVASATNNNTGPKHDIFVGNLAFTTTEEQLHTIFSEVGRVVRVRMVSDIETGKPRGFAFVEFEDPQAALSAIRNMNEYEINGRKLRVNFSNSSHLETLANQLGMDLSSNTTGAGGGNQTDINNNALSHAMGGGVQPGIGDGSSLGGGGGAAGSRAVAMALKSMNKGEMYDVIAKLKELADTNPDEARRLLTQHPQLPEAILYCMSELDMIKTPVVGASGSGGGGPAPAINMSVPPPAITKPMDPRAAAAALGGGQPPPPGAVTMGVTAVPPPVRPADPRAARDPRALAAAGGVGAVPQQQPQPPNFPAPPSMMGMPPPQLMQQQQQQQQQVAPPGLDPNLVAQVMALTPAQIAQLPPDKQQSILALRQQITGGMIR